MCGNLDINCLSVVRADMVSTLEPLSVLYSEISSQLNIKIEDTIVKSMEKN